MPVRVATASVAADSCWLVACGVQRVIHVNWDPYLKNQKKIGRYRGGVLTKSWPYPTKSQG